MLPMMSSSGRPMTRSLAFEMEVDGGVGKMGVVGTVDSIGAAVVGGGVCTWAFGACGLVPRCCLPSVAGVGSKPCQPAPSKATSGQAMAVDDMT